jgi:phosphate transport system permease protein
MRLKGIARGRRKTTGVTLGDSLFTGLAGAMGIGLILLLALITFLLFLRSIPAFQQFGPGFVYGTQWDPVSAVYGALPFVYGTLVTSAIALLLGVPVSLGIAIFLSELSPSWLRGPLSYVVELLAAIPSVVYGFWALFVLAPVMRVSIEPAIQSVLGFLPIFQGPTIGTDKFTAGVVLAVMIIPTISAVSREALYVVPQSQREAALSLGATRWETTRRAVLTYARSGIFGAIILGLGRAVGETMAVTMTIGNKNVISTSLFDQGQSIASLLANAWGEASSDPLESGALLELALVLMLMALIINTVARLIIGRYLRLEEAAA